jgi:nucleoside phosphorylase
MSAVSELQELLQQHGYSPQCISYVCSMVPGSQLHAPRFTCVASFQPMGESRVLPPLSGSSESASVDSGASTKVAAKREAAAQLLHAVHVALERRRGSALSTLAHVGYSSAAPVAPCVELGEGTGHRESPQYGYSQTPAAGGPSEAPHGHASAFAARSLPRPPAAHDVGLRHSAAGGAAAVVETAYSAADTLNAAARKSATYLVVSARPSELDGVRAVFELHGADFSLVQVRCAEPDLSAAVHWGTVTAPAPASGGFGEQVIVVLAFQERQGHRCATELMTQLCVIAARQRWHLVGALMCGIAAGLKNDVQLGDVVVAHTALFPYLGAKVHADGRMEFAHEVGLVANPMSNKLSAALQNVARSIEQDAGWATVTSLYGDVAQTLPWQSDAPPTADFIQAVILRLVAEVHALPVTAAALPRWLRAATRNDSDVAAEILDAVKTRRQFNLTSSIIELVCGCSDAEAVPKQLARLCSQATGALLKQQQGQGRCNYELTPDVGERIVNDAKCHYANWPFEEAMGGTFTRLSSRRPKLHADTANVYACVDAVRADDDGGAGCDGGVRSVAFKHARLTSRECRAVDMESAAFLAAARLFGVPALVVKAVSDHADRFKADAYHDVGKRLAGDVARRLIVEHAAAGGAGDAGARTHGGTGPAPE